MPTYGTQCFLIASNVLHTGQLTELVVGLSGTVMYCNINLNESSGFYVTVPWLLPADQMYTSTLSAHPVTFFKIFRAPITYTWELRVQLADFLYHQYIEIMLFT